MIATGLRLAAFGGGAAALVLGAVWWARAPAPAPVAAACASCDARHQRLANRCASAAPGDPQGPAAQHPAPAQAAPTTGKVNCE
jgi:hypothetical protein